MEIHLRPIDQRDKEIYLNLFWDREASSEENWAQVAYEFDRLTNTEGIEATAVVNEHDQPLGFVVTAFLKPAFEQAMRESKTPYIVPKLISGNNVIVSDRELGKVNASGRLVSTVITYSFIPGLSLDDLGIVKHELMTKAVNSFTGFNLTEIMIEAHSEFIIGELLKGGFKKINTYDEWWAIHHDTVTSRPALMTLTRADAQRGRDFHVLRMFVQGKPQFRFTPAERALLQLALTNITDSEIAEELCVGPDAVKGRWRSIYQKMEDVLHHKDEMTVSNKRSKEKRRRVIEFIRSRPQELRPFYD